METKIRNATLLDIPSVLDFARTVGRFISKDEIRTFLQVDPDALFVAETNPGGKLIGSCFGTQLTPELGFMGLYVVLEEYRGKGIGSKLWRAAKDHLGNSNIGVRGDPTNFKKYTEKEGFCHVEDYTILYYDCFGYSAATNIILPSDIEVVTYFEGCLVDCNKKWSNDSNSDTKHEILKGSIQAESVSKTVLAEININTNDEIIQKSLLLAEQNYAGEVLGVELVGETCTLTVNTNNASDHAKLSGIFNIQPQLKSNINVRRNHDDLPDIPSSSMILPVKTNTKSEEILSGVLAFDESLHKRDRSIIVRQTLSWSTCLTKVALVGGKVVGYACLRLVVTEHWLISPFYADSEEIAEMLLSQLLKEFNFSQAKKGIQIRFPDKNVNCKRLVEKFGFIQKDTRILTGFTKRRIGIDTSKIYSFHSTVFSSD